MLQVSGGRDNAERNLRTSASMQIRNFILEVHSSEISTHPISQIWYSLQYLLLCEILRSLHLLRHMLLLILEVKYVNVRFSVCNIHKDKAN